MFNIDFSQWIVKEKIRNNSICRCLEFIFPQYVDNAVYYLLITFFHHFNKFRAGAKVKCPTSDTSVVLFTECVHIAEQKYTNVYYICQGKNQLFRIK